MKPQSAQREKMNYYKQKRLETKYIYFRMVPLRTLIGLKQQEEISE